jgi:hypothetical protein
LGRHASKRPASRHRVLVDLRANQLEGRTLLSIDLGGTAPTANPVIATAPFGFAFGGSSHTSTGTPVTNGGAGWSVSDVGDVNSDGYDDFLIGGPTVSSIQAGTGAAIGSGAGSAAYLIFGSRSVNAAGITDWIGKTSSGAFQYTADNRVGDLGELGLPTQTNPISGATPLGFPFAGVAFTTSTPSQLGASVSTVKIGNTYGLLIGAPGANDVNGTNPGTGRAYLITGNLFGFLGQTLNLDTPTAYAGVTIVTFGNTAAGGGLGFSVAGGTNIFGDGATDIILGAPNATFSTVGSSGAVYAMSTASLPSGSSFINVSMLGQSGNQSVMLSGAASGAQAGFSVADAGDVNGATAGSSQVHDLLIGAPSAGGTGAAYLVYGGTSLASRATVTNGVRYINLANVGGTGTTGVPGAIITGPAGGSETGFAVSSAGDFNNDGFSDILIGSPFFSGSTTETNQGEVTLLYGAPSNSSAALTGTISLANIPSAIPSANLVGASAGNLAGYALSFVGFINSGQPNPILIGAPGFNSNAGTAYLIPGRAGLAGTFSLSTAESFPLSGVQFLLSTPSAPSTSPPFFGASVSGRLQTTSFTGDSDSKEDFIIGAPGYDVTQNSVRNLAGGAMIIEGGLITVPIPGATQTTTALTTCASPSTYGDTVTFTVAVTAQGNPVTGGTVDFEEGDTVLASMVPLGASGTASFNITSLSAVTHTITAFYSGASSLDASSGSIQQVVNKKVASVTPNAAIKVYGSADPVLTGSTSGFLAADGVTASFSRAAGEAVAGSPYTIGATLGPAGVLGNYTITYNTAKFTITARPIAVTASSATKVYGAALPPLTYTIAGFVNGDTASVVSGAPVLSTTATASSHVLGGPYSISISAGTLWATNYSFNLFGGTLTVTPAPLTITANGATKVYGAALPAMSASYSGFVNGDSSATLATAPTLTTTASTSSHVGSYAITANGAASSDYAVSYVYGSLSVTPAALTIAANNQSKVYGAALPTLTTSYTGWVNGDTTSSLNAPPFISTTASNSSHVGSYAITASGAGSSDYTITYVPGALTITPAPLIITADNTTKTYGVALPALTASYTGFVNGDTAASLAARPVLATTAAASSPVVPSGYAIIASGARDPDYSVSYQPGTLLVTPAPLTIVANNASMVQGAAVPLLSTSYSGFVNGDSPASLSTPPTLSTSATPISPPGTYAIVVGGASSLNYAINYANGILLVTPAPVKVLKVSVQAIRLGKTKQTTQVILVQFSGAMNAGDAQSTSSYSLTTIPTNKRQMSKSVALSKAQYNASTNTVTLITRKPLVLNPPIRLTLNAARLLDSYGDPLSGNCVATLGKRKVTF